MNFHRTIGIWIAMLKQDQDLGDETLEISRLIVEFSLRKSKSPL